jgi:predicted nucleic acid-binding protein
MGQEQFLIDSNVVIDYLSAKMPAKGMAFMNEIVDNIPKISVISKIEVLGFSAPPSHYKLLEDFMDVSVIIPVTEEVASITILLRKQVRIKTPDAIIAATALHHNMILIARNSSDFAGIDGLKIIDPWMIE